VVELTTRARQWGMPQGLCLPALSLLLRRRAVLHLRDHGEPSYALRSCCRETEWSLSSAGWLFEAWREEREDSEEVARSCDRVLACQPPPRPRVASDVRRKTTHKGLCKTPNWQTSCSEESSRLHIHTGALSPCMGRRTLSTPTRQPTINARFEGLLRRLLIYFYGKSNLSGNSVSGRLGCIHYDHRL
jgi:hypothetical protein